MFGATWASWLGGNQRLQLISTSDIGSFAVLAFEDPSRWENKAIAVAGDEKTLNEIDFIFMKQFGYGMPRAFGWMGSAFTAYDKDMAVRRLITARVCADRVESRRCLRSLEMLGTERTSRSVVVSFRCRGVISADEGIELVYDLKTTEQWLTNSKVWVSTAASAWSGD